MVVKTTDTTPKGRRGHLFHSIHTGTTLTIFGADGRVTTTWSFPTRHFRGLTPEKQREKLARFVGKHGFALQG